MQKVNFPKNLAFGAVPLCAPASRTIVLHGVPSRDLPFEVEIVKPHPYFRVDPNQGVIPAGGKVTVVVTYSPLTFGSMTFSLRLSIKIMGFQHPQDCVVSARAVSGLVEQTELVRATNRVDSVMDKVSTRTVSSLGGSTTFSQSRSLQRDTLGKSKTLSSPGKEQEQTHRQHPEDGQAAGSGTLTPIVPPISSTGLQELMDANNNNAEHHNDTGAQDGGGTWGGGGGDDTSPGGGTGTCTRGRKSKQTTTGRVRADPTAIMLASTFHCPDASSVISKAIVPTGCNDRGGFGTSAVPTKRRYVPGKDDLDLENDPVAQSKLAQLRVIQEGPRVPGGLPASKLLGSKVVLPDGRRVPVAQAPVMPRGPGSGAVFDAGSEWMSAQFQKKHLARLRRKEKEAADRAAAEAEAEAEANR